MSQSIISWLASWYSDNCDGDWEHQYGIAIQTIDNPGWSITIDLDGTGLADLNIPWQLVESSANDWYGYKVENRQFYAAGDPKKMEFLLELFKNKLANSSHADAGRN